MSSVAMFAVEPVERVGKDCRPPSLGVSVGWTIAGQLVQAGCQWCILLVLARIAGPVALGQFALGLAVTAPILLFSQLHLRGVQATDARGEFSVGDYLALRLAMTALAIAAVVIVTASGYSGTMLVIVIGVGLLKSAESISDVLHGYLQRQEQMRRLAGSLFLRGPLQLIALCVGLLWGGSLLCGIGLMIVATVAVLCGYDLPACHRVILKMRGPSASPSVKPRWHWPTMRRLAGLTAGMGLVAMLGSLGTNVPRYFVETRLGAAALGGFSAVMYLLVLGHIVVLSIGYTTSAHLGRLASSGDRQELLRLLVTLSAAALGIGAVAVVVAAFWGGALLNLIYGPQFGQFSEVLVLIMVAASLNYLCTILGQAMVALRQLNRQIPILAVSVVASIVAAAILVPAYGLRGAAWALVVKFAVEVAGRIVALWSGLRGGTGRSEPWIQDSPSDARLNPSDDPRMEAVA